MLLLEIYEIQLSFTYLNYDEKEKHSHIIITNSLELTCASISAVNSGCLFYFYSLIKNKERCKVML